MKDQLSIERIAELHPKFRASAQAFIDDIETTLDITIRISQGFRSFADQDKIYAQGRTAEGEIVTHSPAGSTYHNYGLAIDIVVVEEDKEIDWKYDYEKIAPIAVKHGMTWGGLWPGATKDEDHYENKFGYNWRALLTMYRANHFIPGTKFVNFP